MNQREVATIKNRKIKYVLVRVFSTASHRKDIEQLLKPKDIHHLYNKSCGGRWFQNQCSTSTKQSEFTVFYSSCWLFPTFPRWHFRNAKDAQGKKEGEELTSKSSSFISAFLPPIRNYNISQKLPNRFLLLSLSLELGYLDMLKCKRSLESIINIQQKVRELKPHPLKKAKVCQQIISGKEQRMTVGQ